MPMNNNRLILFDLIIILICFTVLSWPASEAIAIQFGNPGGIARAYLLAWQSGDYATMYTMLSVNSKQFISRGEFIDNHRDFARQYIIERYSIIETIDQGQTSEIYYELTLTGIDRPSKYLKGKLDLVLINDRWSIDY